MKRNNRRCMLIIIIGSLCQPLQISAIGKRRGYDMGTRTLWREAVKDMCSWHSSRQSLSGHVVYMIHRTCCSSRPVALCQEKRERIVTLALLFNSSQRRRTQKLFWRAGGTRWKMTFNCTSLAESHPIRALYIFPNSSWWGRAYEWARPTGVAMQRDGCLAPEER